MWEGGPLTWSPGIFIPPPVVVVGFIFNSRFFSSLVSSFHDERFIASETCVATIGVGQVGVSRSGPTSVQYLCKKTMFLSQDSTK